MTSPNKAQSGVRIRLDGRAYSRWKIGCYESEKNVLHEDKCRGLTSGTTVVTPSIKKPRMHNFVVKNFWENKKCWNDRFIVFQVSWQTLWRSSSFAEWDRSKLEIPPKSQYNVNPKFCFKAKNGVNKDGWGSSSKTFFRNLKSEARKTPFCKICWKFKRQSFNANKEGEKVLMTTFCFICCWTQVTRIFWVACWSMGWVLDYGL